MSLLKIQPVLQRAPKSRVPDSSFPLAESTLVPGQAHTPLTSVSPFSRASWGADEVYGQTLGVGPPSAHAGHLARGRAGSRSGVVRIGKTKQGKSRILSSLEHGETCRKRPTTFPRITLSWERA